MLTRKMEHFLAVGSYQRDPSSTTKYTGGSPVMLTANGTIMPYYAGANPELIVGIAMNEEDEDYGPTPDAEPFVTYIEGPALVQIDISTIDIINGLVNPGQFLIPTMISVGNDEYAGWEAVSFNPAGTDVALAFGKIELVDGNIVTVKFFSGPIRITYEGGI